MDPETTDIIEKCGLTLNHKREPKMKFCHTVKVSAIKAIKTKMP